MAVRDVAETTVKEAAATPLKVTAVAPVKLVPVTVTRAPTTPDAGERADTVGAGSVTVKVAAEVTVPPGVVMDIGPDVAPGGTVAEIEVAEVSVTVAAAIPLKVTPVAPVRFVPVMVTLTPTIPDAGVKLVIVGGRINVKLPVLPALPPGVVTLTLPVAAPAGTVAVREVAETTVKEVAAIPLKLTDVAPVKLVPVRVTRVPTGPVAGEIAVRVGSGSVTV